VDEAKILQEKKLDQERRALTDTAKLLKGDMDRIMADKAKELEEVFKFVKGMNDNLKGEVTLEQENIVKEMKDLKKRTEAHEKQKLEREEFKAVIAEQNKILKMKVDLDEVQASLNACQADNQSKLIDLREELMSSIKNQNIALTENINRKANTVEIKKLLAGKVDNDNIEQLLENFLKSVEFEKLGDRVKILERELEKFGNKQLEGVLNLLKEEIDEIKKNLVLKANLEDMCVALDQKPSKDIVHGQISMR
jgi:hypothetical protein